jgi:SAM-dependent methyltransferase/predicted O-methyltransferase YrrM
VLDVGAGDAPYAELFAHADYVTLDWEGSLHAGARAAEITASADAMPLEDGGFDVVLLTQVLEHVLRPAAVLHEIARVLRPGGRLFATVPFVWELHEEPHDYWRFTNHALAALLEDAGFAEYAIEPRSDSLSALAQLMTNIGWSLRGDDGSASSVQARETLQALAGEVARLAPLDRRRVLPLGYTITARRAPKTAPAQPEDPPPVRFPAGHYYSAMYDGRELVREPTRSRIWPVIPHDQPAIAWNAEGQQAFLRDVLGGQERLVLRPHGHAEDGEYFAGNGQFPPLDAWILEGVLRHLKPAAMIEIGSGFSSLIAAQVNRDHLDGRMRLTCIEPYPRGFLLDGVDGITELVTEKVEHVDLARFDALRAGDVVFIDSSHVVRTGGDVVWLFGRVLPRLRSGVHVHIHDVFLPGDYPEQWVREGWGWNEQYLVEAFLQFNSGYEIVLGAQWALHNATEVIDVAFPHLASYAHESGGSLWIRRT